MIEELKRRYEEELKDAETYERLAKECPEYGSILKDISKEEHSHAKHIQFILEHMK